MKKTLNIYDAKTHLSQTIAEIERTGCTVVICRNRRPVADLVPHRERIGVMEPDPALAGAVFKGDPAESLPVEDWPESLR